MRNMALVVKRGEEIVWEDFIRTGGSDLRAIVRERLQDFDLRLGDQIELREQGEASASRWYVVLT